MSWAAQTHLAGLMRPAGRVFETPGLTYISKNLSKTIGYNYVEAPVKFLHSCARRILA